MEKTMKHTCIVRKTMLTPKGSEIIEGIPQGKTFRGISFREDKGSNMVFATKGTSDIGRVESATLDGTEEKIDAVIEAMKADAKVKIVGLGDEPNTFVVEVSVKIPEKLSASTGTDTKAFETEIARIESEGICERSELDKRIKAMRDNRFPDELIMRILKQYRSYKKEVKIPKTIYIDPDPDRNPSVLGECALQMLIGRATIFEGDKSVGKNVAADTLAWMFGMPQYLITFNRLMTQDDIYGTKTTEIPELMKMSDKEVEDLGLNDLAVKQNIALGKQISHEWAKKSVKFEALKAKAASMQIRQEASQLTDWLADGGLMVWNEMNMAESNFFESFANPITDGTGFLDCPGMGRIYINKDCRLIGNQNKGYTGEMDQNDATMSRFGCVVFNNPKSVKDILKAAAKEAAKAGLSDQYYRQADELYQSLMAGVHKATISNSCLNIRGFAAALDAAAFLPGYVRLSDALITNVVNTCPVDERETLTTQIRDKITL